MLFHVHRSLHGDPLQGQTADSVAQPSSLLIQEGRRIAPGVVTSRAGYQPGSGNEPAAIISRQWSQAGATYQPGSVCPPSAHAALATNISLV